MNQYRSVAVVISHSDIVDNQMYSHTSAHREDSISPLSFRSTPGAADVHFWVEPTICRPIYKAGLILFCFFFFGQLVVRAPQVRGMDWVDTGSEPRVQGHYVADQLKQAKSTVYHFHWLLLCMLKFMTKWVLQHPNHDGKLRLYDHQISLG